MIRKIAFIGTGIMGAPIAEHILDAGYELVVYNRTKKKAQHLLERGAIWANSCKEAAQDADVIFTMVGYPADVEDTYLTTDGLLRCAKKGAWLIDLTTSSPQLARDIHDAAEVMDKHAFDCPVTGGEQGAKAGTLTCMIGAKKQDVEKVLPLLLTFSKEHYFFDAPGAGQIAKLCNQVSLLSCMVGYAEALAVAKQAGLDQKQVIDLLMHGMGNSAALQKLAPKSVEGDYTPGFLAEHIRKDAGLALAEAEDLDLSLPGTQNAFDLYDLLCKVGGSRMGTQAISLLYAGQEESEAASLDWSVLDDEYEAATDASAANKETPGSAAEPHQAAVPKYYHGVGYFRSKNNS
ncbi:MAG: NAD(P)-dependent oxidoreductase [Atopobiaceae bacterium]|jgi:3-hydroxyisobutyrate dehydrogenase